MLYAPTSVIPTHIALYLELDERPFVWRIDKSADAHTRTVTICAKDRPGLISRIAGVFTLNNIDILDVQVFTWRNNIALDVFEVTPPPDPIFENERWDRAARNLEDALANRIDLNQELIARRMMPHRSSPTRPHGRRRSWWTMIRPVFLTIVEVFTFDFPGLLFRVTDACSNVAWIFGSPKSPRRWTRWWMFFM